MFHLRFSGVSQVTAEVLRVRREHTVMPSSLSKPRHYLLTNSNQMQEVQNTKNNKLKCGWWVIVCGSLSWDIQTDLSFTLLIIIHWLKPILNKANQEREKNLYTKLHQCGLLTQRSRRVITDKNNSSSGETFDAPITGWNVACIHGATKVVCGILGLLSYLKTFWRSAQQSFTSLCFCVSPAARPGWRLDSWDTLTSSTYHTQDCRLGREGSCNTFSWSFFMEKMFPTMIWLAMSRISLSPRTSNSLEADIVFLWKKYFSMNLWSESD